MSITLRGVDELLEVPLSTIDALSPADNGFDASELENTAPAFSGTLEFLSADPALGAIKQSITAGKIAMVARVLRDFRVDGKKIK